MPRKPFPDEDELSAFSLRLPRALKEALVKLAAAHRRSLNQEIVALIEEAVARLPPESEPQSDR